MEANSINSFHLDSVFLPIKMSDFLEEPNNTSVPNCISQFYQTEPNYYLQHLPVSMSNSHVTNKSNSSSVTADKREPIIASMQDGKRNISEGSSSMTSAQSKNVRDADHGKKQKKRNGNVTKEKKTKDKKKAPEVDAPTGYVHVRARRGQATDSHSLAERVRREKISERMKILQALVPGCDKVTGKALMLDEIINYVQSLQNQVEFLSMKLTSLNHPMYYDFGMELDDLMVRPGQNWSSGQEAAMANTNSDYPLLDSSTSLMFQQFHFPNSISQDNGQVLLSADDQRQKMIINHSGLISNNNNLCSFPFIGDQTNPCPTQHL